MTAPGQACELEARGCWPCGSCSASSLGEPGQLKEPWRELLPNGEIFTALVLSTLYSEKYKGRNMQPDDIAEVRLPAAQNTPPALWSHALLHRAGSKEVSVFIWLGDESSKFPVVYFAFSPLRSKKQFFKLLAASGSLKADTFEEVSSEGQGPSTVKYTVPMFSYVHRKVQNLLDKYDFRSKLEDTMRRYPNHMMLFCGISHGATLSQAMILKLNLMYPMARFQAVTWNAYRWTDKSGVALMKKAVGNQLLPFVMSRGNSWDSIAGAPHNFEPMSHVVFLDAETGVCRPARSIPRTYPGPCSAWRAYNLHFAKTALKATRIAMVSALENHAPMERLGSLTWSHTSSGFLRSWRISPREPFSGFSFEEQEVGRLEKEESAMPNNVSQEEEESDESGT